MVDISILKWEGVCGRWVWVWVGGCGEWLSEMEDEGGGGGTPPAYEEDDEEEEKGGRREEKEEEEEKERKRKVKFGGGGELAGRLIDGGITSKGGGLFRGRPYELSFPLLWHLLPPPLFVAIRLG